MLVLPLALGSHDALRWISFGRAILTTRPGFAGSVQISFEQRLDLPPERLFEFHTHPENLTLLLEGWRGFELLSQEGHIRPEARVTVRQALGPLHFTLTFEHFLFEPPRRFGERQVAGPFASFEHVHEFHGSENGTRLVDQLYFELPWRWGGRFTERWIVTPALRRFFAFRRASYRRLIDAGRI
jgi:ligand-binding SRPBCC domain-containing protein